MEGHGRSQKEGEHPGLEGHGRTGDMGGSRTWYIQCVDSMLDTPRAVDEVVEFGGAERGGARRREGCGAPDTCHHGE